MKIFAPFFLFFCITIQAQSVKKTIAPIASLHKTEQVSVTNQLGGSSNSQPIKNQVQAFHGSAFKNATPKVDLRGVFLPSVSNLSWPTNRKATPAVQQAELITILDNLKANGIIRFFYKCAQKVMLCTLQPLTHGRIG